MSTDDILTIDGKIKENFKDETLKLPSYQSKLKGLQDVLLTPSLSVKSIEILKKEIVSLAEKITDISNAITYNFYILDTYKLTEEYQQILDTPIVISFFKKRDKKRDEENLLKRKEEIVKKYLEITEKYEDKLNFKIPRDAQEKSPKLNPTGFPDGKNCLCPFPLYETFEDERTVCLNCGEQKENIIQSISYKDVDRINVSMKYTYDRIIHFRDCINQYQGKQNSIIDKKVFDDLTKELQDHHLLVNNDFSKITRDHVSIFLKELGYTKHYENINLIHFRLTGIKPDDISYLEHALMDDFIQLTEMYDKIYKQEKKTTRKNFINTQYVLFQLLNRHKHPCKKENFCILKTFERQQYHDQITQELFAELGWNMVPLC